MDGHYDEWKSFSDALWDIGGGVWDVARGSFDAVKDLITGTVGLLVGVCEICIWISLQGTVIDFLGLVPEKLDADVQAIADGVTGILKDPGNYRWKGNRQKSRQAGESRKTGGCSRSSGRCGKGSR